MYRKIVWCYVFILTLLDISLNTKLSAQGKSHGVTVHDSLIEGITFQEWGKESGGPGSAAGAGAGARRAVAADALSLAPAALDFGRAPLAAAHALTVTLTNTANTTMHLASVAGTTPDFHASFFESKTLPPQANTTFSVVYLGRREGPVAAHLYIHTSLGVHKYPVSAVGVASEWGVWPLVGVRVPHNATAEPELTMYNPTDHTIQVSEVYSSGSWLGLRLPGGGESAPRGAWLLPPRAARPIVRLQLQPPPHHHHALTAYVRIRANMTGGGLVVCVEARGAAPGEYVRPWQLRLGARGSRDLAHDMDIEAGNSHGAAVPLEARVWAAACARAPPPPSAPPDPADTHPHHHHALANGQTDKGTANGNGVKSDSSGVYVSLLRAQLEPHQELTPTAQLTLDYAKMWSGYASGVEAGGETEREGAWCAGWVLVGRARLPYSLRLLPGTLRLLPHQLHVVTASREEALKTREVRVRNEFHVPVHVAHVELGPDIEQHFEIERLAPLTVAAGATAAVARLRLRTHAPALTLDSYLALHTNVTRYTLPVYVYSAQLNLEWEWPNSSDGTLRLGGVGASSTRRVALRAHNPAPAPLCLGEARAELPGATLALHACSHLRAAPAAHPCRCVPPGASALLWLTVVAPAREGGHAGAVWLAPLAPHARPTTAPVELRVLAGRLHALPLHLARVAPYTWSSAPLVLESTMELSMRVVDVTQPAPDPALTYVPPAEAAGREVRAGRHAVGSVLYAAEKLCAPHCYTGLDVTTPEGVAWVRRGDSPTPESLRADAALQAARYQLFAQLAPRAANISLHVHTTQVVQIPVAGTAAWWWARLADAAAGDAGLAAVGGERPVRVRAANPAPRHALLLQPVLAAHHALHALAGGAEPQLCETEKCVWSAESFRLVGWRATRGAVREWQPAPDPAPAPAPGSPEGQPAHNASSRALPVLLLAPGAEVEIKILFAPKEALALSAFLYLRNNLTIMEGVQLFGRGAYPSFELGGRRPNTNSPLLFEVSECAEGGGSVRRTVVARNTGRVGVRLREWRVAGQPCQARGFRLQPCAPLHLAPNESRALHLAYTPDYTLSRAAAALHLRTDTGRAAFPLHAATPARLLPACAAAAPRPPFEPALRAAGTLLALAALALVLAAAALDAERELRRARAARPPPAPRRPLDLRALAHAPPPPPPQPARRAPAPATAPPARRRRHAPRASLPALDPHAERRAFERWRAEVLRRADDEDSRSSEDADRDDDAPAPPAPASGDSPPPDVEPSEPRDEPPATDGYEADPETEDRPAGAGDDDADAASTGSGTPSASSSSSSPTVDRDEADVDEPEPEREPTRPEPAAGDETPPDGGSRADVARAPVELGGRAGRQRRDASETPRRTERARTTESGEGARTRSAAAKHHARKDKLSKRRSERPSASPPRASPPRAPAALRWGASWSSVVAAGAAGGGGGGGGAGGGALAPIGSDVRRRAEPEPRGAGDHSLFYFNGDAAHVPHAAHASRAACPDPDYWRALDRPPAFTPARDFLEEPGAVGSGAYRSLGSVWGSALEPRAGASVVGGVGGAGAGAAAWLWGGAPEVRPPPGFGAARPARVYDPFRSLAAIWAPGARDWRADPPADRDD